MASELLMGRKKEHQLVCSTYCSRTSPNAKANAAIRAANVTPFNNQGREFYFKWTVYILGAEIFCIAKKPCPPTTQIKITFFSKYFLQELRDIKP